jgi:hypothetical protein
VSLVSPPTNFGIGALLDQMRPYLQGMAAEAVRVALERVEVPTLVPASVINVDKASGICTVLPDGPSGGSNIAAKTLVGPPGVGQRVMCLLRPPSGVFVVGFADGTPPWSSAWGYIGYSIRTNDQATITAAVDQGVSVTFTAVAGRRYMLSASANAGSNVASDLIIGYITNASNTILRRYYQGITAGFGSEVGGGFCFVTPAAGATTYKLRFERAGGTGNVTVYGDGSLTYGPQLLVEDVGPV